MTLIGLLILIIVIAGAVAVVAIVAKAAGLNIPAWLIQVLWVVLAVVVGVVAIRFIASLL